MKNSIVYVLLMLAVPVLGHAETETPVATEQPTATTTAKRTTLTDYDRKVLSIGEISDTRYVVGGVIGTYPIGLGLGHAIQGRYMDRGWIFTVGELGSAAVVLAGLQSFASDWDDERDNGRDSMIIVGLISYLGFRIWEIADVWAEPIDHNRRYRELKKEGFTRSDLSASVMPTQDGGRFVLQLGF